MRENVIRRKNTTRTIVLSIVLLVAVIFVGGYVYACFLAYNTMAYNKHHYGQEKPAAKFEDVTFPSRGRDYKVYAFYLPGNSGWPALINVHGRFGSRHNSDDLKRAEAWHMLGYNVLSIDLSDNGGDTVEDGRAAMGYDEQYDVLGAFDYLLTRGYSPDQIGIVSLSMGASSSLMAAGKEPRIRAVWADSGYESASQILWEQAARNGFPPIVVPGGMLWGAVTSGDRIWEVTPIDSAATFAAHQQAIYIIQSDTDKTVEYHHGVDMNKAFKAAGVDVTFWPLKSVEHGYAFINYPDEYLRRLDNFFRQHLTYQF